MKRQPGESAFCSGTAGLVGNQFKFAGLHAVMLCKDFNFTAAHVFNCDRTFFARVQRWIICSFRWSMMKFFFVLVFFNQAGNNKRNVRQHHRVCVPRAHLKSEIDLNRGRLFLKFRVPLQTLQLQTPCENVFGVVFCGLNTFSEGIWSTRESSNFIRKIFGDDSEPSFFASAGLEG